MLSLHVLGPLAPKNTSTGAYLRAFQGLCKAQPRAPEYRVPNEIPTLRKRPDDGQILPDSNQDGYADRKCSSPRWVGIRISVAVVGESYLLLDFTLAQRTSNTKRDSPDTTAGLRLARLAALFRNRHGIVACDRCKLFDW